MGSSEAVGLPSKKGQSTYSIGLNIDGEICFDHRKVSDKFNTFYTTVAAELVKKLHKRVRDLGESFVFNFYSLKGVKPNDFGFSLVTENQVFKYLIRLNSNKATGLDGIPSKFVKDAAPIIAYPLCHIINLSLIQAGVPDSLKSARVIPLFKKNDKTEVGNYRPVSILNVISKILEIVVYDLLNDYLTSNDLLFKYQSGFRHKFSTETYLIHLTDFIRSHMDKGNFVGMILLDLQKAFDTVNHSILLTNLKPLAFLDQLSIGSLHTYLTDNN